MAFCVGVSSDGSYLQVVLPHDTRQATTRPFVVVLLSHFDSGRNSVCSLFHSTLPRQCNAHQSRGTYVLLSSFVVLAQSVFVFISRSIPFDQSQLPQSLEHSSRLLSLVSECGGYIPACRWFVSGHRPESFGFFHRFTPADLFVPSLSARVRIRAVQSLHCVSQRSVRPVG